VHSDASTSAESSDNKKSGKNSNGKKEYKLKQKTEMCKNWEMKGSCRWGNKCSYAHGEHELLKKTHLPKNFMTRACETFHKDGFCSFGKRCQFMHSERDVYGD
jgi:butyrate response factor 1